ncbi:hypothetical protein I7I53_00484 [Histoplasma capsulatum var. duboisii H88]|uniref:Uncharacterized protein n=1 Tax=Ajellomyces capsulatus (strain H88) TaxID=544711 RepID=A0A8A1LGV2_AJEC8|nr:hypothetical protein I7I53_00484 [Histoplasma capsulatum var. duboisii H88]
MDHQLFTNVFAVNREPIRLNYYPLSDFQETYRLCSVSNTFMPALHRAAANFLGRGSKMGKGTN